MTCIQVCWLASEQYCDILDNNRILVLLNLRRRRLCVGRRSWLTWRLPCRHGWNCRPRIDSLSTLRHVEYWARVLFAGRVRGRGRVITGLHFSRTGPEKIQVKDWSHLWGCVVHYQAPLLRGVLRGFDWQP